MSLIGKLMTKPWLASGVIATEDGITNEMPPAKIGLWLFLFSISGVFGLFMVAYNMRIELATDWVPVPKPTILWLNTACLVLASVAFEWSKVSARQKKAATEVVGILREVMEPEETRRLVMLNAFPDVLDDMLAALED